MHKNNIEMIKLEVLRLLKAQSEQLNELQNTPKLLKSRQGCKDVRNLDLEEAKLWIETIENEILKVEVLEMTFAIVGTMKAGKSTTINAIVGTEVMPNRNRPMTTLPTLIRHVPNKKIPELTFPKPEVFNNAINRLKDKLLILMHEDKLNKVDIYNSDDGKNLINEIIEGNFFIGSKVYVGSAEIFSFLRSINDISRLCDDAEIMINSPLLEYDDINKFPVIEVEFFHLQHQENKEQGKFSLLDTPGPNEAGQEHLKEILEEQLQKASAVLAVLDYTQLKSVADSDIRQALRDIYNLSKDRLFVLVNKYDQKDRHGMNESELKNFVSKDLFDGQLDEERIYPVSSSYGYLSNRALNELSLNGEILLDANSSEWVSDFAEKTFGQMWEDDILDPDKVKTGALKLWEKSLFDKPLTEVIHKASNRAAFISIESAIDKMLHYDAKLIDYLGLRKNAALEDIKVIQDHVKSLESDIKAIENAKKDSITMANSGIKTLKSNIKSLFEDGSIAFKHTVDKFFEYGKEIEIKNEREKQELEMKKSSLFSRIFNANSTINKNSNLNVKFDGPNKFKSEQEAKDFIKKLNEELTRVTKPCEAEFQKIARESVAEMEQKIWQDIENRVNPILVAAQTRLNDAFSLRLSFSKPQLNSINIDFDKIQQNAIKKDSISRTGTRTERRWYTLWCYEHEVSYSYSEDVYLVKTKDIGEQVQKALIDSTKNLELQLNKFVDDILNNQISDYFKQLSLYLERFRGDLMDSICDKKLKEDELAELHKIMEHVRDFANNHQDDTRPIKEGLAL